MDIGYDAVDNPISIQDNRLEWEWPAGAKPVSRTIQYDDLYRVKQVAYTYAGADAWTSPYAAENASATSDNRQAVPSPHVAFDKRMGQQTFAYDWLGNTTQTGDDASGFYDRSLGTVTNGFATGKPYQLVSASNQATASPRRGHADVAYDGAGNMTGLLVSRNGPCLPAGASCTQRFAYDWDEESRLVRARRWDLASADAQTPSGPIPTSEAAVDLRYAYDADDARVLKTSADTTTGTSFDEAARGGLQTVYVFDSVELRGAAWVGTGETADYELSVWTEVPYLTVGGARLGRVHYETDAIPASSFVQARVYLELPEHLGSMSIVIDRETGELVEAGAYTAQGTTESDYRPERWKSFREDYRFTGKEEDIEVGLTYFGKRFLHAYLGRWMNPDPLALQELGRADLNVYAYVRGRYFAAVDPIGLEDKAPTGPGKGIKWWEHLIITPFLLVAGALGDGQAAAPINEDYTPPKRATASDQALNATAIVLLMKGRPAGAGFAPALRPDTRTVVRGLLGRTPKTAERDAARRLYRQAVAARDDAVLTFRKLPKKEVEKVATVVGGYNRRTGEVTVGTKWFGQEHPKLGCNFCAEDIVVSKRGGNAKRSCHNTSHPPMESPGTQDD